MLILEFRKSIADTARFWKGRIATMLALAVRELAAPNSQCWKSTKLLGKHDVQAGNLDGRE